MRAIQPQDEILRLARLQPDQMQPPVTVAPGVADSRPGQVQHLPRGGIVVTDMNAVAVQTEGFRMDEIARIAQTFPRATAGDTEAKKRENTVFTRMAEIKMAPGERGGNGGNGEGQNDAQGTAGEVDVHGDAEIYNDTRNVLYKACRRRPRRTGLREDWHI